MITRYTLPDGTLIEWTQSNCVNGPDQQGGQQSGTSFPYYRINGGDWRHATSRQFRTRMRFDEWANLSENLQDFLEGEE